MILSLIILGALGWIIVLIFLLIVWSKDEKREDFKVVHISALFDGRVIGLFKYGIIEGIPVVSQGDLDIISQKIESGEGIEGGREALSVVEELTARIESGDFTDVCRRLKSPAVIAEDMKDELELQGIKCIYIKNLDTLGRGKIFIGNKVHVRDVKYSYNKARGLLEDGTEVTIKGNLPKKKSLSIDCFVEAIVEGDTFRKIWARCEE